MKVSDKSEISNFLDRMPLKALIFEGLIMMLILFLFGLFIFTVGREIYFVLWSGMKNA
jgi:hypothetical protein